MPALSLSPTDLNLLIDILTDAGGNNITLEQIVQQVNQKFLKNQSFKVGLALVEFLKHPDLMPEQWQRVAIFTLIHEIFRSPQAPPHPNPFYPILFTLLHTQDELAQITGGKPDHSVTFPKLTKPEKVFLAKLLTDKNFREALKKTPNQILKADVANVTFADTIPLINVVNDGINERMEATKAGASSVLSYPENSPHTPSNLEEDVKKIFKSLIIGDDEYDQAQKPFIPELIRIAPPILPIKDELAWIIPSDVSDYKIMYDTSMCVSSGNDAQSNRLMAKAFKETLSIPQQEYLLQQFKKDPNVMYSTGLSASTFPDVVEHNPLIAIEVLLKLMSSHEITNYLSALVNMEMSLHSMEVVNRLTALVDLPQEFVQLYINNCINTSENIKDRYMQNRLVRLVCVFIQSLIRNKIISDQELFVEIETFCVGFSRIREAAALYKLIKNLDSGDNQPTAQRNLLL